MRKKKVFKVIAITLVSIALLMVLFVASFIFNPFEGSLPDMRDAVPRDVDFFLRKTDLAEDFTNFPEPDFWKDLVASDGWQQLRGGPNFRSLNRDRSIEDALEAIREQANLIKDQSWGYVDVLEDVIGTELQIAGRFGVGPSGGESWCVYTRVTWPLKFLWGVAGYGFAQEQFMQQGIQLSWEGAVATLESNQMPGPLFAARHLDCLMLSNDKQLLNSSLGLASGAGVEDSFGRSASYHDGVEKRLRDWENMVGEPANAVEFYMRPDRYFPLVDWDDGWPDPRHPDDMNERVMASFLNLQNWLFLTGSAIFEHGSLTLLADFEINQNLHTAFQAKFFKTEPQHRKEWLDPFLKMVPATACACAGMRMPASEFISEMYRSLGREEKELLDENLRKTGKYRGAQELIKKLEVALLPRTGFVFRKNVPDPQIKVANPSPAPQVAWVFWLRKGGEKVVYDFIRMLKDHRHSFGFTQAFKLPLGLTGKGGDAALEFTNPQIPATGEIATIIYDQFLVVSNSGLFIRDMFSTRSGDKPSITQSDAFAEFSQELPDILNGFVFLQAEELEKVLLDYEKFIRDDATSTPDAEWAFENRSRIESEVFRARYAGQFASIAALKRDRASQRRFDDDVAEGMDAAWKKEMTAFTAGSRDTVLEILAMVRLFRSSYVQIVLEPRHLRLMSRTLMNYR